MSDLKVERSRSRVTTVPTPTVIQMPPVDAAKTRPSRASRVSGKFKKPAPSVSMGYEEPECPCSSACCSCCCFARSDPSRVSRISRFSFKSRRHRPTLASKSLDGDDEDDDDGGSKSVCCPCFKACDYMVPCAGPNYPFSIRWPCMVGEPDFLMKTLGDIGFWQILVVMLMMMFNLTVVFQVASPEVSVVHEYGCLGPVHKFTTEQWRNLSTVTYKNFRGLTVADPCIIKDLPYGTRTYHELKFMKAYGTRPCLKWKFNESRISIISRFNLACPSLPVNNLAESMFSLGNAVGGIFSSFLSDRFGRRKLLMAMLIVNVLFGFGLANSTSYQSYLSYRMLMGFSCSAINICSFVVCLEITGGKWRDIFSTVYMLSYPLGYITLYLFSRLFLNWVYFQNSITLVAIFLISIWWLVPESPRFYLTAQNLPGLMRVLETSCDFNRKNLLPQTLAMIKAMPPMVVERKQANPLMLFRTPAIRRLSLVFPFVFFFSSITYYGLVLNNDLFTLGLLYSGIIEFIACLVVLMLRLKNDVLMVLVTNALAGVCCLVGVIIMKITGTTSPENNAKYLEMATLAARFFGGMMNSSLSTIAITMYPTLIRTMGAGWANFFTNIGVAVAANIVLLSNFSPVLPLIVLGFSSLLGSFAMLFLPGRVSRDLLDLPEEVEFAHETLSRCRRDDSRATLAIPRWEPPESEAVSADRKSVLN